jgi:uncharacterized membrane protein YphA (DoxX/SURF4 family)
MKTSPFILIVKLITVSILLQTLFFKFTGAEESIYIFQALGIEPFGRIGSGIVELFASVFILIPRTTLVGAILGLSTMIGALFAHIFVLGIVVKDDGGTLFYLAIITLICCLILVYNQKHKMQDLKRLKF